MLASPAREEAAALNVRQDLIEDVLRRVIRRSIPAKRQRLYKTLYPNLR